MTPDQFAVDLLKALDINTDHVTSATLVMDAGKPPVLTLTRWIWQDGSKEPFTVPTGYRIVSIEEQA